MTAQRPNTPEVREMHDILDDFLRGDVVQDQPELYHAVKALMTAKPEYRKPITMIPTHEVELRRDYAVQIEKRLLIADRNFKLTSVHLTAIMMTPLENLERHGYLSPRQASVNELASRLTMAADLVKTYIRHKISSHPHSTMKSTTKKSTTKGTKPGSQAASSRKSRSNKKGVNPDDPYFPPDDRGLDQKDLCRDRDKKRCIFTQTAQGDVAHIIPRTWNDSVEHVLLTKKVIAAAQAFMDQETFSKYEGLFADDNNLGTTDKHWNMLYLNKQQHWYLDHTSIGLKCLGIEYPFPEDDTKATVLIQLNWLHRTKLNPNKAVTSQGDGNDFDKMIEGLRQFENERSPARVEDGEGMFAAVRVNNHVPLISGHVVRVTMASEDAHKCKAMLDLSWTLGVIAAMSGAAEWLELSHDDDDDREEISQMASVDQWVQDQTQRYLMEQSHKANLPSGAPSLPAPGAPGLPPRSPDRPAWSPDRSPSRPPDRSLSPAPAPPPRTPDRPPRTLGQSPAERLQSPIPLGMITNRPRQDSSPKRKLRLELLDSRARTSPRRGDATRDDATRDDASRDPSPDKGSEKLQQGQEPGSPQAIVLQTESRRGSPRSPRSPRK
ncbi:hypothetical protein FPOAC2_12922 [Fusarium poae]|uniref:hypothetical protein n=1 Tax=Fusarium poae TaxID=36050 RepID=UPI001CE93F1E|nr:hypothetical protein FPOAC1_012571 [Fusarium poae]KAG8667734.1 hypothetical protein FPOAC1_012571 [Fusarium poae]